jgi:hypothetical protein
VRTREAAKQDQMRARHRLSKFLLRSGQRPPSGVRPWTYPYLIWVELAAAVPTRGARSESNLQSAEVI